MRFTSIAILIMAASTLSAQKVEDGWKGLLPYKSTRADVEKVVGKGEKDKYILHWKYETAEATVEVLYADDPCGEKGSSFEVPAETAITFWINLKQPIPISELSFERNGFARYPSPTDNPTAWFYYYQAREKLDVVENQWGGHGIEIEGEVVGDREYAKRFVYRAPWSELHRSPCVKTGSF